MNSVWCIECQEVVIPIDNDGSYFCPKCSSFLGGCRVISFKEWKRREEKLLIERILNYAKSF